MKKVLIAFFLMIFLGGILFFFIIDFKGQSEGVDESTDLSRIEDSLEKDSQSSLNNLPKKKFLRQKEVDDQGISKLESVAEVKPKKEEGIKGVVTEFELDSQYYPSLGGYLKVDGKDIQALEVFFRETDSFIVNLSFTKVTNSIFQVENSFWNLHKNSDGKSYNLRIGNGPLSGNILTFTEKKERNDNDENTQLEDENRGSNARDSEETNSYEDDFLNNEQEDNNFSDENNTSPSEHYDETMGNSTFE